MLYNATSWLLQNPSKASWAGAERNPTVDMQQCIVSEWHWALFIRPSPASARFEKQHFTPSTSSAVATQNMARSQPIQTSPPNTYKSQGLMTSAAFEKQWPLISYSLRCVLGLAEFLDEQKTLFPKLALSGSQNPYRTRLQSIQQTCQIRLQYTVVIISQKVF